MGGWPGEGGEVVAVGELLMDLSRRGQSRDAEGRRPAARPGLGTLGRRSGRVPALPYPPPRLLQCIRDHGHLAIPGWVARSQDGAEEFAWDRVPGPGGCHKDPRPREDCRRGAGFDVWRY